MASSLIIHGAATGGIGVVDNTTRYFPLGGGLAAGATEVVAETPVRDAGTFSKLFAYVLTNTATVNSVFTLRKSQAATALTFTVGADATGIFEDTTNSVTYDATDECDLEVAVPTEAGTNTLTFTLWGVRFAPTTTTNTVSFMAANTTNRNASISPAASTNYYFKPNSFSSGITTGETNQKYRIRSACVAQDFYVYVASNSRTTTTVFSSRKNGAAGGMTVSVTAGATGAFEDTSGTDTLAAGDDFNYELAAGNSAEAISLSGISCSLVSTNGEFHMLSGTGTSSTLAVSFNTTTYLAAAGNGSGVEAAEASTQIYPRVDFAAKELTCYVSANTIATSASTVTIRDNGADSAVTVSIAAGATGLFSDSTNGAKIHAGVDEICYKIVTPNTSGTLTFRWMSCIGFAYDQPATGSYVVTTGSAISTDYVAEYFDNRPQKDSPLARVESPVISAGNITTITTTNIVGAAGSDFRRLKSLVIRNRDASTSQTVAIGVVGSGTVYYVTPDVALATGQTLHYHWDGTLYRFEADGDRAE